MGTVLEETRKEVGEGSEMLPVGLLKMDIKRQQCKSHVTSNFTMWVDDGLKVDV